MPTFIQANADEILRISEIENVCFPAEEAASLSSFKQRFAVFPECFFVLKVDGEIVGHINGCINDTPTLPDALYADASLHRPKGKYQTVFGLAVDPAHQRKGYASLLTQQFIAVSKSRGHHGIVLTCKDYLVDFYQQQGFQRLGQSASSHGGSSWNDMLLTF
ncbi:GNAT family N-acetyltransferase [Vibrio renipiscarius]|uniref:GCN5 family acetyltransferase n=1 Tax=Vibrio renipiscarius TaxID=1461322 RepID=A0A0C2JV82_9VIBR|nr:GNAT family N-acetyltransferase [Vibrio renipiscarius]KII75666.1 GCN5 family acetyltransferase [Vibrio renipiscarius]KII81884.1 GCN5 family acetyltransferase [Vibrio renipiscarius]